MNNDNDTNNMILSMIDEYYESIKGAELKQTLDSIESGLIKFIIMMLKIKNTGDSNE